MVAPESHPANEAYYLPEVAIDRVVVPVPDADRERIESLLAGRSSISAPPHIDPDDVPVAQRLSGCLALGRPQASG